MSTLTIVSETKNIRAAKTVGEYQITFNLQKEEDKIVNNTVNFNCNKNVSVTANPGMPNPGMMGMGMGLNGNYNVETEKIHIMSPFDYDKTTQELIKEVISGCKELGSTVDNTTTEDTNPK